MCPCFHRSWVNLQGVKTEQGILQTEIFVSPNQSANAQKFQTVLILNGGPTYCKTQKRHTLKIFEEQGVLRSVLGTMSCIETNYETRLVIRA